MGLWIIVYIEGPASSKNVQPTIFSSVCVHIATGKEFVLTGNIKQRPIDSRKPPSHIDSRLECTQEQTWTDRDCVEIFCSFCCVLIYSLLAGVVTGQEEERKRRMRKKYTTTMKEKQSRKEREKIQFINNILLPWLGSESKNGCDILMFYALLQKKKNYEESYAISLR